MPQQALQKGGEHVNGEERVSLEGSTEVSRQLDKVSPTQNYHQAGNTNGISANLNSRPNSTTDSLPTVPPKPHGTR